MCVCVWVDMASLPQKFPRIFPFRSSPLTKRSTNRDPALRQTQTFPFKSADIQRSPQLKKQDEADENERSERLPLSQERHTSICCVRERWDETETEREFPGLHVPVFSELHKSTEAALVTGATKTRRQVRGMAAGRRLQRQRSRQSHGRA